MPEHAGELNGRLVIRARHVSQVAAVVVAALGALSLVGWGFDVALLKSFYADITIKANTALALLLSGVALWLLIGVRPRLWTRTAGQACAVLVGAIGAATLSEHLFGWDLGIDQLLFTEEAGALATMSPGRMGPPASTCFALAGTALVLLHRGRSAMVAELASVGVGLVALLAVTGYAYGAENLYGIARYTGIALHTGVALLALSVGLLTSTPERGLAALLVGHGAGSLMARRLLAFAIAVPLLLGAIRVGLENRGVVDQPTGIALLVLALIVSLGAVITHTAVALNRLERQKLAAESELRDRLHEIETMMDVLPVGVFVTTDRSALRIAGNRSARELLRLPPAPERRSLGEPIDESAEQLRFFQGGVELRPEDLPVRRAARDAVATHDIELEVVLPDGERRHILLSALPLLDERGQPRGAIGSMMDITERKAAEKERGELLRRERDARAEAEAANRAKDVFLAALSHELRTPLNAILGWASLLRDGTVVDEQTRQRAIETIHRMGTAQAQLIEDLLDVSRITSGVLRLNTDRVDLVGVLKDAADVVRPIAEAKGVRVSTILSTSAGLVLGDSGRLQQVVWNLLTNSVKFTDRGGSVDMQLSVAGSHATVTITDDGQGIAPEFLPHIFDWFRQDGAAVEHGQGGLGLGLSIARELVELHGGTLEAESAGIGAGSRFTIRLPLAPRVGESVATARHLVT